MPRPSFFAVGHAQRLACWIWPPPKWYGAGLISTALRLRRPPASTTKIRDIVRAECKKIVLRARCPTANDRPESRNQLCTKVGSAKSAYQHGGASLQQDLSDQPRRAGAVLRILCFSTKSVIGAPVHSFGLIWEIFRHIRRASQLHANRLRSTEGAAVCSLALAIVHKLVAVPTSKD